MRPGRKTNTKRVVIAAASAQAAQKAESMRGHGDIWPPQGMYHAHDPHHPPEPQSATVSQAEDTVSFVPSRLQQNKGHRKAAALGTAWGH